MRLFVATTPPPDILRGLEGTTGALRALPLADGLRWCQPAAWHLTLAFFGEVDQDLLPALTDRLARAASRHGPVALRLDGGGRFRDQTLWIGVSGETDGLARLAASVAAGGRRSGLGMADEGRAFRAHLTLARARPRHRTDLRPYVERLASYASREWIADRIELIRSRLPDDGTPGAQPRYETLESWPLAGVPDERRGR